jgi:hypothetical protein
MNVPFDHFFIMLHSLPKIQKAHLRHAAGQTHTLDEIILTFNNVFGA